MGAPPVLWGGASRVASKRERYKFKIKPNSTTPVKSMMRMGKAIATSTKLCPGDFRPFRRGKPNFLNIVSLFSDSMVAFLSSNPPIRSGCLVKSLYFLL
jgi:hypothetical protein